MASSATGYRAGDWSQPPDFRHCEEQSDEAIQSLQDWIASLSLAMTRALQLRRAGSRNSPEHSRGEQAVAREIARRLRAGHADRSAACGEQILERLAILA